jgi:hypothetical protein
MKIQKTHLRKTYSNFSTELPACQTKDAEKITDNKIEVTCELCKSTVLFKKETKK